MSDIGVDEGRQWQKRVWQFQVEAAAKAKKLVDSFSSLLSGMIGKQILQLFAGILVGCPILLFAKRESGLALPYLVQSQP